jgi:hypothetical protein
MVSVEFDANTSSSPKLAETLRPQHESGQTR